MISVAVFLLAMVAPLALWLKMAFVFVTICVLVGALFVARKQHVGSVFTASSILVVKVLCFATFYYAVYREDHTSFRASSDYLRDTYGENLERSESQFEEDADQAFLCQLLLGIQDQLLATEEGVLLLSRPGFSRTISTPFGYRVRVEHKPQTTTAKSAGLVALFAQNSPDYAFLEDADADALIFANNPSEVQSVVERCVQKYQLQRSSSLRRLRDLYDGEFEGDFPVFLLYSGAISTTVGSNDIAPSNSVTRIAAVVQACLSLLIFTFAIEALIKNPKE